MMDGVSLVIKIGSMALIRREDMDIDYNIFARLASDLRPGMLLVSSGATEIGRLDYIKRAGHELSGDIEQDKTDYAAQGQAIVMANYRKFVRPEFSLRQVLVEHTHFNDPVKREHIRRMLLRAAAQGAIPIINYNDPVSDVENRKLELAHLMEENGHAVECVDNDETAAVVASLVRAPTLLLLTSTDGIYRDPRDPASLVTDVVGDTLAEVEALVEELMGHCVGASRAGAGGARAKLLYALKSVADGTTVIIGHARHHVSALLAGDAPRTLIGIRRA